MARLCKRSTRPRSAKTAKELRFKAPLELVTKLRELDEEAARAWPDLAELNEGRRKFDEMLARDSGLMWVKPRPAPPDPIPEAAAPPDPFGRPSTTADSIEFDLIIEHTDRSDCVVYLPAQGCVYYDEQTTQGRPQAAAPPDPIPEAVAPPDPIPEARIKTREWFAAARRDNPQLRHERIGDYARRLHTLMQHAPVTVQWELATIRRRLYRR
jgi:hypothetical protein